MEFSIFLPTCFWSKTLFHPCFLHECLLKLSPHPLLTLYSISFYRPDKDRDNPISHSYLKNSCSSLQCSLFPLSSLLKCCLMESFSLLENHRNLSILQIFLKLFFLKFRLKYSVLILLDRIPQLVPNLFHSTQSHKP